jgi:hypothetical protein
MARKDRVQLIKELASARESTVICYVTGTRENLSVPMAMDVPRIVLEHLRALDSRPEKIDLLIHSDGGDGVVPWRLVTLLREYCSRLAVLVRHRAFSAATLTALGADEIVMLPLAMLGPVDPTVWNEFNPSRPDGAKLGISVEDVAAYVALVKDDVGITHEDELVQSFNILAQQVHPLALGNVKRQTQQSSMMARKLLELHMDKAQQDHQIGQIVEALTSHSYYHGHPICRTEAKSDLGLKVIEDKDNEGRIWNLYLQYEAELQLQAPFRWIETYFAAYVAAAGAAAKAAAAAAAAGGTAPAWSLPSVSTGPLNLAIVESEKRTDVSKASFEIVGVPTPDGVPSARLLPLGQDWEVEH